MTAIIDISEVNVDVPQPQQVIENLEYELGIARRQVEQIENILKVLKGKS